MYKKYKNKFINIKLSNKLEKYIRHFFTIFFLSSPFLILGCVLSTTNAEQMGSSPNTGGAQSVIIRAYNFLVSKGETYGSSSSPNFTQDWGTYWNRIMYSASWEPQGTATSSDVLSNKTFISNQSDRSIQSGTASSFDIDYSSEQYVAYDDNYGSDYQGLELTWTNTNSTSGSEVWYDTRTDLYWSYSLGGAAITNSFTISSCDFFNTGTYPTRGDYGESGTDPDCGNAINACAVLSLASTEGQSADTDWYLPSQKELKEAYIDGILNQTGFSSAAWSSTERASNGIYAWYADFTYGTMTPLGKANGRSVHCVRRD